MTLLPTPSAANPNEGEDLNEWASRRARIKESGVNGNGFGMPLGVAVRLLPTPTTEPDTGNGHARNLGKEARLLPTPQVADADGGHASRSGDRSGELLLPGIARSLLPTPRASRGAASTETMYALGGERVDDNDAQGNVVGEVAWGDYEPAVRLWESLTRPAPAPTLPDGKNGNHRLSARLPEWMMGYPDGWVTDILDRNPAIRACGNGVSPQQAHAAINQLWSRVINPMERAA